MIWNLQTLEVLQILTNSSLSSREGDGTPLQSSCLENPMDGGAWWATVHGVAKSQTRLSDFNFTFHFHALEKEIATHSSVLAWRIPGMGEPGGLPSTGSHRVGHNWSDLAAAAAAAYRVIVTIFLNSIYNLLCLEKKNALSLSFWPLMCLRHHSILAHMSVCFSKKTSWPV